MKNDIKKGVVVGVIVALILLFLKWLGVAFFSKILIPVWLLLFLLFFSLMFLITILIRLRQPKYFSYTEDNFDGLKWRWNYNAITCHIIDPKSYCPSDDTLLVAVAMDIHSYNIRFHCETCNNNYGPFTGNLQDNKNRIIRQIDKNIRTKF